MTVDREGKIFFQNDSTPYRLEELDQKVKTIFERRDNKELLIRADRNASYGTVVQAISLVKKAGIERVGLMTEEEKEKKR